MFRTIAAILCLSLASCAPSTVQELRQQTPNPELIIVNDGYQAVYRDIREFLDFCVAGTWHPTASTNVSGNLYTDIRKGEITYRSSNIGDVIVHMYIELIDLDGKTEVAIYYTSGGCYTMDCKAVGRHLTTGSNECK